MYKSTVAAIREHASAFTGQPWRQPRVSDWARYWRDGNRTAYEAVIWERRDRLSAAVVLALLEPEQPHWIDEVADGVISWCEQSSWCWPAHDDAWQRRGWLVPDAQSPFVDLGAGEAVAQLAAVDQALGAQLETRYPGLRERIRVEASRRVFRPFIARHDWHWLGLDGKQHNWNPWISGNVLYAATLCEDPAEQAALRQSATNNLRRYVAALPLDGAIDEGAGYWWNGAGRLLEALDELHNADAAELLRLESVCNTVRFPAGMALGGGWCANFSDAAAYPEPLPWHLLFRAAMNTDDEAARAFAVAGARRDGSLALLSDGLPRVLRALKDKEWAAALTAAPDDRLPLQSWWPSTQVLVAHQSSDASGLGIAAKGGHNGENHNHLDVGSVIVASDGVPVIVDPGRPTYTADTFSEARYSIWTMRSDWHSVPQLAGRGQGVGEQFTARDVAATLTPKLASLQADIGGAYLTPGVSWLRTTTLDRANGVARISDSSDCADAYLHWIIAGDVTVRGESLLVHPARPAAAVNIRWEGATLQSVTERPLGDPTLQRVWGSKLTRLTLRPTGAQVKSSLEVSNRV